MKRQTDHKQDTPPVGFDEVLKRMLSAPPKPKTSEKPADKKKPA